MSMWREVFFVFVRVRERYLRGGVLGLVLEGRVVFLGGIEG